MNENEERAFRTAYEFYSRWRETVIEDDDWERFGQDVGSTAKAMQEHYSILGVHLLTAVVEAIGDLYKDGMKPIPAGYIGREDI